MRLSLSTAPLAYLDGKPYYDLPATLTAMKRLHATGLVQGFELQVLAEWDSRRQPVVDAPDSVRA